MHVQMIHSIQIWLIDPLFSIFICISPSCVAFFSIINEKKKMGGRLLYEESHEAQEYHRR